MEEKKNLLTYAGLKKLEEKKLQVRSKKQENRVTFLRMLNMMQQKMSRETSKQESKKSKKSLKMQKSL